MDDEKKKRLTKEAAKAAGIAGASAAIGAAYFAPDDTIWGAYDHIGRYDSPIKDFIADNLFGNGDGGLISKVENNPNLGIGINAAASGIGGLAAYGLLRGATKGLKKLGDKNFERKVALHNATNNIKVNNS